MRNSTCETGSLGFTLIEVVAALVIFSLGVLMVAGLMTTLNQELERTAIMSELVVLGQESLDSISMVDHATLSVGSETTTVTVRGRSYDRIVAVSPYSPLVYQVDVTVAPDGGGEGPTHTASTYVSGTW